MTSLLVINAGSSSIKFKVYDSAALEGRGAARIAGQIAGIGGEPRFSLKAGPAADLGPLPADMGHSALIARLLDWLQQELGADSLGAVGHRVVHGGAEFAAPVVVDADFLARLQAFVPLAPQHQPHNLAAIRAVAEIWPGLEQVACFDTAFHRAQPKVAQLFGLPASYYDDGVRRYGFHGLSYEYIAETLPGLLKGRPDGRVVVAHLGHGASMCAIGDGQSVATTMGFTALDGLPMGSRSGSVDPGLLLYLLEEKGLNAAELTRLLYDQSGLLGLSGESDDMRALLASGSPGARLAVDYFVYRIGRELGSLAAALGGLDALVFTAGIGENAPEIRSQVCAQAAWLGVAFDAAANAAGETLISAADSAVSVWAIPTDEELMIARHAHRLVSGS